MISSKKSAASIVAAKTARACDSCVKKRARWYCAADDAFLCQTCDSSVHSANPLARRHERVKLKTALSSSKNTMQSSCHRPSVPAWHRGFTRKPRTPRQVKSAAPQNKFPIVPEVGADDMSNEEEHVSYRVPIFHPFVAELTVANGESKPNNYSVGNGSSPSSCGFDLPSDIELADFAADLDSLLGRGLDDHECFGMLGLGLVDYDEKEASTTEEGSNASVKVEDVDEDSSLACQDETTEINLMREPFVFNFEDYDDDNSPGSCAENEEEEEENVKHGVRKTSIMENKSCKKRKTILRLDYDDVISKWDSKGTPFAFGDRPDVDSDCLPEFTGTSSEAELLNCPYGDSKGVIGLHSAMIDGGREARVSRYREKRRTRLFSKKIRYEVRKLNAEKRPRMKGRFVKRVSFGATGSTCPMLTA